MTFLCHVMPLTSTMKSYDATGIGVKRDTEISIHWSDQLVSLVRPYI